MADSTHPACSVLGSIALLCGISVVSLACASAPPNIVLILTDDLGYTDLGCQGSNLYQTPHIDRFADSAMSFTNAYSSHPTCSPSRAALLTGKYPARLGIIGHGAPGSVRFGDGTFVPADEVTIAEALQRLGYSTCHIGKWHVGTKSGTVPKDQGFALDIASNDFCCPGSYFYPFSDASKSGHAAKSSAVPDLAKYSPDDHLSECLANEAVHFIETNRDRPFFLYLSHYAVHTPIEAEEEKVHKYEKLVGGDGPHQNPEYAGLVEHLDDSVGRVLQAIDDNGLRENTVVIFTSDNGGELVGNITSNAPLRDGKVSLYEGGIRVPMFVRWPGVTKPGAVCHTPVIGHDLFPTIVHIAAGDGESVPLPDLDGEDLGPLLAEPTAELQRESLHWLRYPVVVHYRKGNHARGPCGAVRQGDWKLLEFFATPHGIEHSYELYNLHDDISERENLAEKHPETLRELQEAMRTWRSTVGAPGYDVAYHAYESIP